MVEKGKMSTYLNTQIKAGDTLQVMPPMGKFIVDIDPSKTKNYVLFGGGSGITPLMGIAKEVLHKETNSNVTLVYANRNPDSVIFKQALADMEMEGKFMWWVSCTTANVIPGCRAITLRERSLLPRCLALG